MINWKRGSTLESTWCVRWCDAITQRQHPKIILVQMKVVLLYWQNSKLWRWSRFPGMVSTIFKREESWLCSVSATNVWCSLFFLMDCMYWVTIKATSGEVSCSESWKQEWAAEHGLIKLRLPRWTGWSTYKFFSVSKYGATKQGWSKELMKSILEGIQEIFNIRDSPHKTRPATKQIISKYCMEAWGKMSAISTRSLASSHQAWILEVI